MRLRPSFLAGCTPATLLLVVASGLGAQGSAPATPRAETWRLRPSATAVLEYDDNVFLLRASRKDDLGAPSPAELQSGRYSDMASARDAVASLGSALRLRGNGLGGRDLDIVPQVALELYTLNSARSNALLGLAVVQDLARGGRVRARATYAPTSFRRNYLAGVQDANGDGFIEAGERRYAPGKAQEFEFGADYRHRLKKARRTSPLEAAVQLGAGLARRTYAAPFAGRDYAGLTAEARLLLDFTPRVAFDLGYGVAMLEASPTSELLLVLDGANRRAVAATVDRSRTEHAVGARARFELTRRSDLSLGVERRERTWTSTELTDLRYNGRRDARNSFDAELTTGRSRGLQTVLRVRFARQDLTRGMATGGEDVDDYARVRVALGVRYTF